MELVLGASTVGSGIGSDMGAELASFADASVARGTVGVGVGAEDGIGVGILVATTTATASFETVIAPPVVGKSPIALSFWRTVADKPSDCVKIEL